MTDLTTEEFDALVQSLGGLRAVRTGVSETCRLVAELERLRRPDCESCQRRYPKKTCAVSGDIGHRGPDYWMPCFAGKRSQEIRAAIREAVGEYLRAQGIYGYDNAIASVVVDVLTERASKETP